MSFPFMQVSVPNYSFSFEFVLHLCIFVIVYTLEFNQSMHTGESGERKDLELL